MHTNHFNQSIYDSYKTDFVSCYINVSGEHLRIVMTQNRVNDARLKSIESLIYLIIFIEM